MKAVCLLLATWLLSGPDTGRAPEVRTFSRPAPRHTSISRRTEGRLVCVAFWASWWAPSKQSFPRMPGLSTGRGADDGLVILAVNADRKAELAHRFLAGRAFGGAGSAAGCPPVETDANIFCYGEVDRVEVVEAGLLSTLAILQGPNAARFLQDNHARSWVVDDPAIVR